MIHPLFALLRWLWDTREDICHQNSHHAKNNATLGSAESFFRRYKREMIANILSFCHDIPTQVCFRFKGQKDLVDRPTRILLVWKVASSQSRSLVRGPNSPWLFTLCKLRNKLLTSLDYRKTIWSCLIFLFKQRKSTNCAKMTEMSSWCLGCFPKSFESSAKLLCHKN